MPQNFYTFLIIPKKKSSAKKFNLSSNLLKGLVCCLVVIILSSMYAYYDYIKIKRDRTELERLRKQTKEQKLEIDGLVEKVNIFSLKMEELNQLDKNIRTMANIEDKRYKGQLLGIGGSINEEMRIKSGTESDHKIVIAKIHQNVDQLTKDANEQKKSFNDLFKYLRDQRSIVAATPSMWPVQGWVTSEFGYRTSPLGGAREFHKGIDIAVRAGIQIAAPADGIVSEVSYDREMGNAVKIDHGYGMSTWYGHLLQNVLTQGAIVKRGDLIGYVGNTGRSTGSHLHYSILLNGVPINPRRYLN
jgi:murein DD-endopeptidase MepM/ murein hydrolase activator NlpD